MRDKKLLYPELQAKIALLEKDLEKENIKIGWAETLRTKAEQDNLYAKGRSKPGPKVTNAPGDSYRSMHQWGIAADFYLIMDIDGDGQTKDDAYNNAKKTFNRVGQVAKKLGLEWGGDWKSIRDLPHLQLSQWGSTPKKLIAVYGTPKKFMESASWETSSGKKAAGNASKAQKNTDKAATRIESAKSFNKEYAGTYKVKDNCNLMAGAGTGVVAAIKKDTTVQSYGYYTAKGGKIYLFVQCGKKTGFLSKNDLK